MSKPKSRRNSRFPSRAPHIPRRSDGVVLVIVMIVATLMLVALAAALPSVLQEGEREREAELQFRGTQYARAVALFHKQFNRYPVNVKELMGTNGFRFLRKQYPDPMDPKGKWRFIHVTASGVLLDSVNQPLINPNNNTNPAGLGINGSSPASSGSSFGSSFSLGGSSSFGFQNGNSGFGSSSFSGGSGSSGFSSFSMSSSGTSTGQEELPGAYIVGVAATSKKQAIKVWKKYDHYNQWEFIGLDMGVFGIGVGMPTGGTGGFGQQNTPQGSSFSPGGFSLNPTTPNQGFPPN
jgi:type II secretory pathway pseudopilin PulG